MYLVRFVIQYLTNHRLISPALLPPPHLVLELGWSINVWSVKHHYHYFITTPPPHLNPPDFTWVPCLRYWASLLGRYYILQPNIIPIHDHGEIFWGERCTKLTSYLFLVVLDFLGICLYAWAQRMKPKSIKLIVVSQRPGWEGSLTSLLKYSFINFIKDWF